jgi:hypothetical protein
MTAPARLRERRRPAGRLLWAESPLTKFPSLILPASPYLTLMYQRLTRACRLFESILASTAMDVARKRKDVEEYWSHTLNSVMYSCSNRCSNFEFGRGQEE